MRILYMVELFHIEKIGERGVPNSHKLKTIRQISPWRDLIHLWSGKIVYKSQYTLYFRIFLKKLYTLHQETEGVCVKVFSYKLT